MTWLGPVVVGVFLFCLIILVSLLMKLRSRFKPIKLLGTCVNSTIPLQLLYSRSPLGFCEKKARFVRCAICIYIYYIWILHKYTHIYMTYIKLPVEV